MSEPAQPKPDAICQHCGKRYADHKLYDGAYWCRGMGRTFKPENKPASKRKGK